MNGLKNGSGACAIFATFFDYFVMPSCLILVLSRPLDAFSILTRDVARILTWPLADLYIDTKRNNIILKIPSGMANTKHSTPEALPDIHDTHGPTGHR